MKTLSSSMPRLSHVRISGKSFNDLSNVEFSSMIQALYVEGGNSDFDQWAIIEFHSIRIFPNKKIQGVWDDIDAIFTIDNKREDGWSTFEGKKQLLALSEKMRE